MLRNLFMVAVGLLFGVAPASATETFYGLDQKLGNGIARTWVTMADNNRPESIGIILSETALQGLPDQETEAVLEFPAQAEVAGFKHAVVNWNPHGHVPPGVYDVPHFDFHFYCINDAARRAIMPTDHNYERHLANNPAAEYLPSAYMKAPGGVPQMGAHWVDKEAPEFNGGTFTRTFIYGSYNGKVTFLEPMITMAYLQTHPDVMVPIPAPAKYATPGYYPLAYTIAYDGAKRAYAIGLAQFMPQP